MKSNPIWITPQTLAKCSIYFWIGFVLLEKKIPWMHMRVFVICYILVRRLIKLTEFCPMTWVKRGHQVKSTHPWEVAPRGARRSGKRAQLKPERQNTAKDSLNNFISQLSCHQTVQCRASPCKRLILFFF